MTTMADALAVETEAQVLQDLYAQLVAAGVNADGFGDFSVERALPAIDAAAIALEQSIRADVVKAIFLELAATLSDPNWLRRLAKSFYQIDWRPAGKAVQTIQITNLSSGGPYNIKPGDITASTAGGLLFDVSDFGTLLGGIGQTTSIPFTCQTAGVVGNVSPGLIVGTLKSAYPAIAVTNTLLVTSGREDETNSALVTRCLNRWGAQSDGGVGNNPGGLTTVAQKAAPTITRVFIRDDNPFGPGSIGVSLANDSGPATVGEVAAADAALQKAKPNGSSQLITSAAPAYNVIVSGTIFGTNTNAPALAAASLTSLARQYAKSLLPIELIRSICMGARFDTYGILGISGVSNVALDLPTTDLTIPPDSVLTFSFQLVQAAG